MDLTELARRNLLDVFGERDPEARAAAINEVYAENVTFTDPEEAVVGRAALNEKAQRLLDSAPGFVFSAAGPVRLAGNLALLEWHFGPEGQPPVATGTDVSIMEDGRITALYTLLN